MINFTTAKRILTLLLLALAATLTAQIKLAAIFCDNMVLQQGLEIPVWGWASPGEKIKVTLDKATVSTKADQQGKWQVKLPARQYGGPFTMTIKGKTLQTLENVMFGEVWICSGQSNMEFPLIRSKNGEAEVAASHHPDIRLFTVKKSVAQTPRERMQDGEWQCCSPASSPQFSAVAYYFGRALYEKFRVPIGLINASWGGTVAETWISRKTIAAIPDFASQLAALDKMNLDEYLKNYEKEIYIRADQFSTVDAGMAGDRALWADPNLDDSNWKSMPVPGYVEQNGLEGFDGVIWFRKTIEISAQEAGKFATLSLARINDSDHTFLNGHLIGATALNAEKPRSYIIPAGMLQPGKNILTVQVEDIAGICGIHGDSASLKIIFKDHSISLSGEWKYKVGVVKISNVLSPNAYPTLLYNAMISPLLPYGIRGAIWYQGEGNASRARQYQRVLPALITDWREHWQQGDFPFIFVQLPNFMKADSIPSQSTWAELREAQSQTLGLANTGMAVTIDVGEANDIHPKDKQTVGNRLALSALNIAYKQEGLFSGPVYQHMTINGSNVMISFDEVGNGLEVKDKYGYLKGFAVAGQDQRFYWAQARIVSPNSVELSSPQVQQPVAVRYGWSNNPEDANLYNSSGLPASPFRTDRWPGITE